MRYELDHSGNIVPYNGSTQFVSNPESTITAIFSQGIHNCSVINRNGSIYTIEIINSITNASKIIDVYYGNIRNESRNEKEKKIQLNSKDPNTSSNEVVILGIYCYQSSDSIDKLICAAWNIDSSMNYSSNPSIRGINVDLFQQAKFHGFIKNHYRNNAVCIFRPEFIHFYLNNKQELHNETSGLISETVIDERYSEVIQKIYYGAPGTGKSHKVREITKNKLDRTERVTFHPEYDYASFIGGYKPTMDGDDIKYEFVPQIFTNTYITAWNDLENDYYLIIEEINRGNCAEIFGDIFQLLDRNSDYDITPSKELKEYLLDEDNGLKDKDNGLKNGKLKLPPNLNILATMNTSDQSLYPMDSAFKRRWDWEYIPINYSANYIDSEGEEQENESHFYLIKFPDGATFKWIEFIHKVNNNWIKNNQSLGMDKCLGNYFIKTVDKTIPLDKFINKAIFYLWNDVFKDEPNDKSIFKGEMTYEDFFPIQEKGIVMVKEILNDLEIAITLPTDTE